MDATSWTRLASQCLGKQAFSTPQLADKVMRRRGRGKPEQQIYRCPSCGYFHIGRGTKSVHASAKRARRWEAKGDDMA